MHRNETQDGSSAPVGAGPETSEAPANAMAKGRRKALALVPFTHVLAIEVTLTNGRLSGSDT